MDIMGPGMGFYKGISIFAAGLAFLKEIFLIVLMYKGIKYLTTATKIKDEKLSFQEPVYKEHDLEEEDL